MCLNLVLLLELNKKKCLQKCAKQAVSLFKKEGVSLLAACKFESFNSGHHVEVIRTTARNLMKEKSKFHGNQLLTNNQEMCLVALCAAFA